MDTPFSHTSRAQDLQHLAAEPVDILVIGGGITGAGIARDASRRGLKTALVDRGDFASGTSSRSSRLIHGGIRYLEYKEWRLVFEASRERRRLRRLAPHLVRPLPFLIPAYRGARVPPWKLFAGLWLYDLLAAFRNVRRHDWLGKRAVGRHEPGLRARDLVGAGIYYDAQCDDARLTLSTVRDAYAHGARVASYAEVTALRQADGRVQGAVLRDVLTGDTLAVRATVVVNATGPWADQVRCMAEPHADPIVRLTRGTHVVVPRARLGNKGAVTLTSPIDGRVMFVLPWEHLTYIGTTDVDVPDPDRVRPTGDDVVYLLRSANALFPGSRLTPDDVWSAWAGVRALAQRDPNLPESSVSREHLIEEMSCGLLSIVGGKLTTYRAMAEQVVDRVVKARRRATGRSDLRRCSTHRAPLPGGEVPDLAVLIREVKVRGLDHEVAEHLVASYGTEALVLVTLVEADRALGERILAGLPHIWAEIDYAAQREMAMTLSDVLFRRTHLYFLDRGHALPQAPRIAARLGELIGWQAARIDEEVAAYRAAVDAHDIFRSELAGRGEARR